MSSHSILRLVIGAVAAVSLITPAAGVVTATVPPATEAAVTETPTAPPPTEAPPTEEPTDPAPEVTTAPGAPDDGTSDDGIDWVPIALIALAVLALVLILGMVLGGGSKKRPPAAAPRSPQPSPQANLLSTAQWIHDQLTLELAAADPASAKQRWTVERSRLDNVAIGAQQQWQQGGGDAWQALGQTMSALGAAVDTNINLRNQTPPQAALIAESTDVVNRHRAALQQLITAMWPTVHR